LPDSDKIYKTIEKIVIKLKEILEENSDYCGSVKINFYMGGITSIEKKENLKVE